MLRLSAFDAEPGGGSLADVVLDASEMTDAQMERIGKLGAVAVWRSS